VEALECVYGCQVELHLNEVVWVGYDACQSRVSYSR
jgi:hypothetical protein